MFSDQQRHIADGSQTEKQSLSEKWLPLFSLSSSPDTDEESQLPRSHCGTPTFIRPMRPVPTTLAQDVLSCQTFGRLARGPRHPGKEGTRLSPTPIQPFIVCVHLLPRMLTFRDVPHCILLRESQFLAEISTPMQESLRLTVSSDPLTPHSKYLDKSVQKCQFSRSFYTGFWFLIPEPVARLAGLFCLRTLAGRQNVVHGRRLAVGEP